MHRWFGLDDVPGGTGPSVVTLGNFDGVHRGHAAVLATVVAQARLRGALSVAVTFDPHPLLVLHPDRAPQALLGLDQRLELVAATGLDAVLVQPFTHELAAQTPAEYVESVFVRALGATAVVIGHDVRFGVRNSGDFDTLRHLGEVYGFEVVGLEDLGTGDSGAGDVNAGRRWSSTWVRDLIAAGDVAGAADVLGRLHAVGGTVVRGQARGRQLGYPTANVGEADRSGMVPADGVYAGWLTDGAGVRRPAAISIGTNPQFEGTERTVEAFVIDSPHLDLYDQHVSVEFAHRLRGMAVFSGVDALIEQMGRDVEDARRLLRADVTRR